MCHMTFILRKFFLKGMDKCSQESAKVCNSYIMTWYLRAQMAEGGKSTNNLCKYSLPPRNANMHCVWNNPTRLPSSAEEPNVCQYDKQPGHWDHIKMICRKTRLWDRHSDYTDTWPWVCKKQVDTVYCISRTLNVFHDHYNPGMEGGADFFFEDLSGLPPFSWLCIRSQTIKCKNIGDLHLRGLKTVQWRSLQIWFRKQDGWAALRSSLLFGFRLITFFGLSISLEMDLQ